MIVIIGTLVNFRWYIHCLIHTFTHAVWFSVRNWNGYRSRNRTSIYQLCKIRSDCHFMVSACYTHANTYLILNPYQACLCCCYGPHYCHRSLLPPGSYFHAPDAYVLIIPKLLQQRHKTGFPVTDDIVNKVIRCTSSRQYLTSPLIDTSQWLCRQESSLQPSPLSMWFFFWWMKLQRAYILMQTFSWFDYWSGWF